jgi:ankyrin repeat protein
VNGRTAIFYAAYNGHIDVVRYLVEQCGANAHVMMDENKNAAFFAESNGHNDVVDYLNKL